MAEEKEGLFIAEFSFDCGIVVTCHQNTLMTRANSSLPVKRYEAKSDRGEVTTIIRDAFFRLFFLQHHQLVILVFFFFFFSFFPPPLPRNCFYILFTRTHVSILDEDELRVRILNNELRRNRYESVRLKRRRKKKEIAR